MRLGLTGFLSLSGGAMTGPLSITANVAAPLTINRPDGLAPTGIAIQQGGVSRVNLNSDIVEPYFNLTDSTAAARLNVRMSDGRITRGFITESALSQTGSFTINVPGNSTVGRMLVLPASTTKCNLKYHEWIAALGLASGTGYGYAETASNLSTCITNTISGSYLQGLGTFNGTSYFQIPVYNFNIAAQNVTVYWQTIGYN